MKRYFVELTLYVEKNNLEVLLQEEFKKLEHVIIPENKIKKEIDFRYAKVLSEYHRNKGKAKAIFDRNAIGEPDIIYFTIGKSILLNLIQVKGEIET